MIFGIRDLYQRRTIRALLADAAAADFVVMNAEAFAAHEQTLRARRQDYGRSARLYHTQGAFLSAADYINATRWIKANLPRAKVSMISKPWRW